MLKEELEALGEAAAEDDVSSEAHVKLLKESTTPMAHTLAEKLHEISLAHQKVAAQVDALEERFRANPALPAATTPAPVSALSAPPPVRPTTAPVPTPAPVPAPAPPPPTPEPPSRAAAAAPPPAPEPKPVEPEPKAAAPAHPAHKAREGSGVLAPKDLRTALDETLMETLKDDASPTKEKLAACTAVIEACKNGVESK